MLWKLNAAFPSVIWQIYDWYLQPNAGYYFMQNAVEPIHIQFNQNDSTVAVINRTHHATGTLMLQADVYDTGNKQLFHQLATANLPDAGVKEVIPMAYVLKPLKGLSFVVLSLKNSKGNIISRNTYWMAPGNNYTAVNALPKTQVTTKLLKTEKGKTENKWTLQITNNSDRLAFFLRPQLLLNGEELRPSYWSASYISLAPHESSTVWVSAPVAKLGKKSPAITVEGWNVPKQYVNITAVK